MGVAAVALTLLCLPRGASANSLWDRIVRFLRPHPAERAPDPVTHRYPAAGKSSQELDLHLPAKPPAEGAPLLVYIHGGAWISGSRAEAAHIGRALTTHGFAVAAIDYRLSAGRGYPPNGISHPAHAEDCAAAIDWLLDNAGTLHLNADRFYVMGHSAGATLTAQMGLGNTYLRRSERLRGLIGLEGIYDLPALEARFPDYADWFLNAAFGTGRGKAERWKAASPQFLPVRRQTPWLLVHSSGDSLVNEEQTSRFAAHLSEAAVPTTVVRLEGKEHDQVPGEIGLEDDPTTSALLRFLGVTVQ